ncbi:hypothetical protein LJC46_04275 [Desulfovibrio sp. OttesenSCG-928-G15]|nr:hypothetical protein [Desulfovibrio sp. OttesenSCG-928-G15]
MSDNAIIIRHETLRKIHEHVEHARIKHSWPPKMGHVMKFLILESEVNELARSMLKNDLRGIREEALDAIAVLVRIVEGE